MLGAIGEEFRMDGTIAAAVNIAARLENLCKRYQAFLLVSQDVIDQAASMGLACVSRFLGRK